MHRAANEAYVRKLRDPRWQKRRLQIMQRDQWLCQWCGDATTELQVHHLYYWPGQQPWDYPDDALITLCHPCHDLTSIPREPAVLKTIIIDRYCDGRLFAEAVAHLFIRHSLRTA